jgi:S1-C subfamily serine protease
VDPSGKRVALGEGPPDPFRFIKFFELSDVRLALAERDGQGEEVRDGVCIHDLLKGTMFSTALQAGDIVTAIDGIKATSREVFRKLLRKRLAQGGPRITFTVRRAGEIVEVAVPVKD